LKKTLPGLGNHPGFTKLLRPGRLVIAVVLVFALGWGGAAWIIQGLADPAMLEPLAVCVLVMVAISLLLSRQLQLMQTQRDRAQAQAGALRRQMADLLRKHDRRIERYVDRRVQGLQNEIADLRARESLLKIQAYHDSLTGLANRLLLADRFHSAVERAKRSGKSFALLMIDLNDFKAINDDYGHAAGDVVLVTMARRLAGAVRASDTVARLGGDEFVLIVESFEHPQELVYIGQKLISSMSDPITLDDGILVRVSASVGMGLYPDHGADMNDLLCVADHAMYTCKSTGQMSLQ
jgi:diguanylate cyclase (GGDEF)-like protein